MNALNKRLEKIEARIQLKKIEDLLWFTGRLSDETLKKLSAFRRGEITEDAIAGNQEYIQWKAMRDQVTDEDCQKINPQYFDDLKRRIVQKRREMKEVNQ